MKRFYFLLLRNEYFWSMHAFSRKRKLKRKFSDNHGKKNCRLFYVLAHCPFTKSDSELDYYHQKVKVRVASRVSSRVGKGLKTWYYIKLANSRKYEIKKIPEKLRTNGKTPNGQPKAKF